MATDFPNGAGIVAVEERRADDVAEDRYWSRHVFGWRKSEVGKMQLQRIRDDSGKGEWWRRGSGQVKLLARLLAAEKKRRTQTTPMSGGGG